jgi:4,5-dihydroxyphthalate decarboxylase
MTPPDPNAQLTLAFTVTDRTRPLLEGAVTVPGFNIVLRPGDSQDIFKRGMAAEFDITEMSMATHIVRTARGDSPYVGIPVFLSRTFRHNSIYIRADRAIRSPADLKGKTIGLREYQQTAALWVRGLLLDQYGVAARDITWRTGGVEAPGGGERLSITLPPEVDIAHIGKDETLNGLLASGRLDAVIAGKPPSCFGKEGVPVARLFPNYWEAELAYHRATGFFPIMHVVVVRKDVAEQHPTLPAALFQAFAKAKQIAQRELTDSAIMRTSLPWLVHHFEETKALMGENYWRYGFAANRAELDAMARYAVADGLTAQQIDARELFHALTLTLSDI